MDAPSEKTIAGQNSLKANSEVGPRLISTGITGSSF